MTIEVAFAQGCPLRSGAQRLLGWRRHNCSTPLEIYRPFAFRYASTLHSRTKWRSEWRMRDTTDDSQSGSMNQLRGKTFPLTTPLFYVNAKPHMGSAYPTMAADVLARFYRLAGANPIFVTGCDEHGEKVAQAASASVKKERENNDPSPLLSNEEIKAFCDETVGEFEALWKSLNIRYDRFIRTTSQRHASIVREFMERVWNNGDIYKDVYQGMYCTGCEEYKDTKDLVSGELCPTHMKSCELRNEENYFFALSKYQQQIEEFHDSNPHFVQPPERRNEVLGWVKDGLRDFSVSRANNPWGIPVPRDSSHTIYVWFDALLGYVSALLKDDDQPTLDAAVGRGWPAHVHIIGKDILRFHAIYWPAMLMSAGLPLPHRVLGHGFLTKDGLKMGKSLGNTLDPAGLVDAYGSDAVRFYFMRGVEFGRDGDFSEERFISLVNADLANSLGNLLNRSLNLLVKNCASALPIAAEDLGVESDENCNSTGATKDEINLRAVAACARKDAYEGYIGLDFVGACESVLSVAVAANAYIDRVAPWAAFKSSNPGDVEAARRCIVAMLEVSRIVAVGMSPVTPHLSRRIYEALGLSAEFDSLDWESAMNWGRLEKGMTMSKPKPVFPRLEAPADKYGKVPLSAIN